MTWVYLDGAFVPAAEARVAATDAGLLYGRGLFETFRARRGVAYRLECHLRRLQDGAQVIGIPMPEQLARLPEIVRELAERCELGDARMRLTVTAGPEGGRPAMLLQARPATDYPAQVYERGITAVVVSVRRNESSPLARVKSLNHLDNLLAKEEARRAGADEALLLNTRGLLAEASTSNVFLVREGKVLTPPVADGALPGITRGAVLEVAEEAGVSAREASLTMDDLRRADEAFLTNAVAGVLPLVSVDGQNVGTGMPGEITVRLGQLYTTAAEA